MFREQDIQIQEIFLFFLTKNIKPKKVINKRISIITFAKKLPRPIESTILFSLKNIIKKITGIYPRASHGVFNPILPALARKRK